MPIADFEKIKKIDVPSVTGTPTISKAQCLKIEGGDDSTTGTGNIVLDWTNISSKADIRVYDENGTLLDYYFESFDATAETAVIWVYRDWIRDGSTQAQVAYGSGPSDQSVVASTVFDKETNLAAGYLFNESSGDLLDVTSNNNDGTIKNSPTREVDGQIGSAYDFDGSGDWIEIPALLDGLNKFALEFWVYADSFDSENKALFGYWGAEDQVLPYVNYDSGGSKWFFSFQDSNNNVQGVSSDAGLATTGSWFHYVATYDSSDVAKLYINGSEINSSALNGYPLISFNASLAIAWTTDSQGYWNGKEDNIRIYTGTTLSSDDVAAKYAATKSSPDFFSQEAGESTTSKINTFFPVPF